jgi:hypothetical protein
MRVTIGTSPLRRKSRTARSSSRPAVVMSLGQVLPRHAGSVAEFETNLRTDRQLEGIADAKARGRGRKASIDPEKVKALKSEGMGPSAIAKALKIGRASVYRALEN